MATTAPRLFLLGFHIDVVRGLVARVLAAFDLEQISGFEQQREGSESIVARIEIRILALDQAAARPQRSPPIGIGIFRHGIAQDIDQFGVAPQLMVGFLVVDFCSAFLRSGLLFGVRFFQDLRRDKIVARVAEGRRRLVFAHAEDIDLRLFQARRQFGEVDVARDQRKGIEGVRIK